MKFQGHSALLTNWGDDLSLRFFEHVTGKKLVPVNVDFSAGRYLLIGSILSFYGLQNAIVYGSGIMTASDNVHGKPQKIISVRGPLTRQALIKKGIDCPEKYGDPALLLPVFYQPSLLRSDVVSVIPNEGTFRTPNRIVDDLIANHGCRLVNMTQYKHWTEIIDAIASSSFVIAESLHGLIVAETYNVPCIWVEFIEHGEEFNADWSFKYRDFYESIGKYGMSSKKLYEGFDFDELLCERDSWRPGNIDYQRLLECFPFDVKAGLQLCYNSRQNSRKRR